MSDSKSVALGIIRAEHRTLAAVLDAMKFLVAEIRTGRMRPDFPLLWAMIYYIDAFPDRLHHPKENDWLFAHLRLRTTVANALIDELLSQHACEEAALGGLRRCLGNFEAGVAGSLEAFAAAVQSFVDFSWRHMKAEEHELMPLAEAHLEASDWDDIAMAFSENGDPLAGQSESKDFLALFRRIVEQTPAPLGLGPSGRP